MPSVAAFKDGFNVKAKSKVGRFIIKTNKTGHDVIDNFVKYEFPMKIVLFIENPKEDDAELKKQLQAALEEHVQGEKVIYSDFGNPYICTLGHIKVGAKVARKTNEENVETALFNVTAHGQGLRSYDLPSLKDATEEKHKAAGRRVASKEEMDEYLGAYRVISSRWSTGVCNTCQEKMEAGDKIAQRKDHKGKGGFSHAVCLVEKFEKEGGGEKAVKKARGKAKEGEEDEEAEGEKKEKKKRAPKKKIVKVEGEVEEKKETQAKKLPGKKTNGRGKKRSREEEVEEKKDEKKEVQDEEQEMVQSPSKKGRRAVTTQ